MPEPETKKIRFTYNENERRSVVTFSNGIPKASAEFQVQYMKSNESEDSKRLLHVKSSHLSYMGNNFENSNSTTKFLVAEIDEESGIVEVFDTDFYETKPMLKWLFPQTENENSSNTSKTPLKKDERTYGEKQDDLTDVFGSHRQKRALAARLRNNVADSSVLHESVDTVLKNVEPSTLADAQNASTTFEASNLILTCNKLATDVADVYKLSDLIPEGVIQSLIAISRRYMNISNEDEKKLIDAGEPSYVIEHAKEPPRAVVGDARLYEEYVCCLQLLYYLMQTYRLRAADVKSAKLYEEEPAPFRKWFFSEYFLGEGRQRKMPPRMKDKILGLGIVLAWNLDSFSSNSELLRADFRISQRKLSDVVRALGGVCKITKVNSIRKEISVLALPLKFPNVSTVRSGRRG